MVGVSGPILKFLSDMYPTEPAEQPKERKIAESIRAADLQKVASKPTTQFKVRISPAVAEQKTVRIQYDAMRNEVSRIAKHLRKPSMPANKIGKYTFEHFLKTECPE